MRAAVTVALTALYLASCSDAELYSLSAEQMEADRVSLAGRVCTEDPVRARFPVRAVLLVDRAAGPLFSDFDPAGERIGVLTDFVQDVTAASAASSLAVIGFGGRPEKLAPNEGSFTRNPGELFNAVSLLSVASNCIGDGRCRDYRDALRSARALIEGELAALPAGDRVLTQFVVILVTAGPQSPMATGDLCCAADDVQCQDAADGPDLECEKLIGSEQVASLAEMVEERGAAGLRFHAIQFAAQPDPASNDATQAALEQMVFAGGGTYRRYNALGGFDAGALNLLQIRTVLRAKLLLAANINARPSPSGPLPDTDGDGLADDEEEALGTDPGRKDSDGDGVTDRIETLTGLDPLNREPPSICAGIAPVADRDLDGLTDCDEELLGTDPTLVDSDGDGMPDFLEVHLGTDYLEADAQRDSDGDGIPNGDEIVAHSDPRSTDTGAHLSHGYRYEIEDEGVQRELFAVQPRRLTGVEITAMTGGTTAGVGTLFWDAEQSTLQWQDAGDPEPGPAIAVEASGTYALPSGSYAPVQGDDGRRVEAQVTLADLPPTTVTEQLRIVYQERQCLSFKVRNIRLMQTQTMAGSDEQGINNIILFLAEAAEDRGRAPGPFRRAQVRVQFDPPNVRDPSGAILEVTDEEFVRPVYGAEL